MGRLVTTSGGSTSTAATSHPPNSRPPTTLKTEPSTPLSSQTTRSPDSPGRFAADATGDVTAAWARDLDPTSPIDRAAASDAVGRYGPDVDATLVTTYPGLLTTATPMTGDDAEARSQQARENTEALTAGSAARTLCGDDVPGGFGGNAGLDREEAAIAQDGEAAAPH